MSATSPVCSPPIELAWADAAEADALAVSLQALADRLVHPLAAAADAFVREQGWNELGYARASDYARERLDRSSRWLSRLAALGRVVADCPRLADAVTGDDGGAPLGTVKALAIASVTTPEGVVRWIDRARAVSVREIERDVREARLALREAADAERRRVLGDPRPADGLVDEEGIEAESPRTSLRIAMPRPARAAFDEALDLFRAVTGGERTIAAFVEALVAESDASGCSDAGDVDRSADRAEGEREAGSSDPVDPAHPAVSAEPAEAAEAAEAARLRYARRGGSPDLGDPARASSDAAHLQGGDVRMRLDSAPVFDDAGPGSPTAARTLGSTGRAALAGARSVVRRAARLFSVAGRGDAPELDRQLRALVALENELSRAQARLLLAMREARLFGRRPEGSPLPFESVGHYARARLGVSRDSAERLVRLARGVRRHGTIADAYEEGRITSTAASLVLRAIGRRGIDGATEAAWIDRAERATVRRLRDEVRLVVRESRAAAGEPCPAPLDDGEWCRSFRREPGSTLEKITLLGADACRGGQSWTGLFLRLTPSLADDFRAAIDSARRAIAGECGDSGAGIISGPREPLSDAQRFTGPVPIGIAPWEGLMRMLLDFAATHDPPAGSETRRGRRVYERDGYRCAAPGCTSRANLEDHHVTYRSRGGGDGLENRITLCRFHHQRGEHGGRMSVRGIAPLGLVFRLGRGRAARRYRNDLEIGPAA